MSPERKQDREDARRRTRVKRRRRPTRATVAILSVAIALLAIPALGVREAVLGLIGREEVDFAEGAVAPEAVRVQFEDLSLGVPPRMDPGAVVAESRRAGTFRIRGRNRSLWVAPTARGGFCWFLAGGSGGCLRQEGSASLPDLVPSHGISVARGGELRAVGIVSGWLFTPEAARVTIGFEDGQTKDVPFVYVSPPIDAGYFAYSLEERHARAGKRPNEVVVSDVGGDVLARSDLRYRSPPSPPAAGGTTG